jgi:hypothetical protein
MSFLPKKYFKWKEPKAFLQIHDKGERSKRRWWHQPLSALVATALLFGSWYLARFNPQNDPPSFSFIIIAAPLAGIFFGYVLPWITDLCPTEIHCWKNYLVRVRGNTSKQVKYSEIESFAWHESNKFSILVLKIRKSGKEMILGVPKEISKDALSQFLIDRHIIKIDPVLLFERPNVRQQT